MKAILAADWVCLHIFVLLGSDYWDLFFFYFFKVFAVETLKKIKIPWNLPNISQNSSQENNADVVENGRILDTYVCSCWYWNKRKLQCL